MLWVLLLVIGVLCFFSQGRKWALLALALWVGAYAIRFVVVPLLFYVMLLAAVLVVAYAVYQLIANRNRA